MPRYERDFIGRVRGMWERIAGDDDDRGHRPSMDAAGPGAEGYYLSRQMAYDAEYNFRPRDRDMAGGGGYDRGYGMAQFGRAGMGRGYGGDYQTGRGGPDRDEFFVNRRPAESGYRGGVYERDLGMRGGMAAGPRRRGYADDYGADYGSRGFLMGYDRGYGAGRPRNPQQMDSGLRGYYSGTSRAGGVIGQTSDQPGMVYPPEQGGRFRGERYRRGYDR
ncbi:MAG TPA: hypothetical protein VGX50_16410 [Longimicrobium sp.]|nr:hypothetical protein [Longimicrobium sp.]